MIKRRFKGLRDEEGYITDHKQVRSFSLGLLPGEQAWEGANRGCLLSDYPRPNEGRDLIRNNGAGTVLSLGPPSCPDRLAHPSQLADCFQIIDKDLIK